MGAGWVVTGEGIRRIWCLRLYICVKETEMKQSKHKKKSKHKRKGRPCLDVALVPLAIMAGYGDQVKKAFCK